MAPWRGRPITVAPASVWLLLLSLMQSFCSQASGADGGENITVRRSAINTTTPGKASSSEEEALFQEQYNTLESMLRGVDGVTPTIGPDVLINVCINGRVDMLALLLRYGASVDGPDQFGSTPLYHAAAAGREDMVLALLEARADVDGNGGPNPLAHAVRNGHLGTTRILIEANANVRLTDGLTKRKPLIYGIWGGHAEPLRLILEAGAAFPDVNVRHEADGGATPIVLAVQYQNAEVVRALLEYGAQMVDHPDGRSLLTLCASYGKVDVLDVLLDAGRRRRKPLNVDDAGSAWSWETALHAAAVHGHLAVVRRLLEEGAAVDIRRNTEATGEHVGGFTPLMDASHAGHAEARPPRRPSAPRGRPACPHPRPSSRAHPPAPSERPSRVPLALPRPLTRRWSARCSPPVPTCTCLPASACAAHTAGALCPST